MAARPGSPGSRCDLVTIVIEKAFRVSIAKESVEPPSFNVVAGCLRRSTVIH